MLIKGWNFSDDFGELNIKYSMDFILDFEDEDFCEEYQLMSWSFSDRIYKNKQSSTEAKPLDIMILIHYLVYLYMDGRCEFKGYHHEEMFEALGISFESLEIESIQRVPYLSDSALVCEVASGTVYHHHNNYYLLDSDHNVAWLPNSFDHLLNCRTIA